MVDRRTLVNFFGRTETFFVLSNLFLFDGIIGFSFIKSIKRVIGTEHGIIYFEGGREKLKYLRLDMVNALRSETGIPKGVKKYFLKNSTKTRSFLRTQTKLCHTTLKFQVQLEP